jgi:hypothetical protein
MIKTDTGIYSLSTIDGRSISLENTVPLITEFQKYLKGSEQKKLTFLDTLPFTDKTWTDNNFSQTPEELNDTSKTVIFLDDKKTIARINESPDVTNIKPFYYKTKSIFNNYNVQILTNKNTGKIIDYPTFESFYYNRGLSDGYVTEKYLFYGSSYSGNVNTTAQNTSFLNTPYFINSILDGVEKEKNNNLNPYISTGYLFLNSLPLIDTKGYLADYEKEKKTNLFESTPYIQQVKNKQGRSY